MKNAPVRHALEYAALWPFLRLLRALPHGASRALGAGLGGLAHALDGHRRRVALGNLAQALPELPAGERARIARGSFRSIGAAFCDALSAARFDRVELCRRVTLVGLEHLAAAEAPGRGVVLLTAHYGTWEIAPQAVSQARGPLAVVGRPADNPHVDREIRALRERFGNRMLDKRGSVRELFRILRGGGRVGLLIDQRVRPEEGIDVPFFGRPALTSPIVARLALRTRAPIVLVFAEPEPEGRYRVEIHPAIEPEGPDDDAATYELTRRCLEACERVIRARPERWLWAHRRWRHA
ncbi:MAG TPA: lysophospholipid acyltransferase family protein [Thermoanaerobaculia bacterium]|nr:lysophospholipid acyltransferase family protein [Thermoanaerobaculia bacterium]